MIQLNLLPPKVRAAELLRKIVIVAVVAYTLAFVWLGWKWSLGKVKLVGEQKAVARVQAQLDSPQLKAAVAAVQKFADDMAAVKAEASVVNELRKQQVPVVQMIDAVPDWTMDGQVWVVNLDSEGLGEGRGSTATQQAVNLQAAALSRGVFVRYYDFMGGQPLVGGLTLIDPPTDVIAHDANYVQFKLQFMLPSQP